MRQITTHEEFKRFMSDADKGARYTANEWLRVGRSKWIARALQEGWFDVLKSMAYQLARRDVMKYGDLPSMDRMDQIIINAEDHKSFRRLGRRMTGDAA